MTHTFPFSRIRSLVAVLLALVFVASACGDDGGGGSAAGGSSFCEVAQGQDTTADAFDPFSATPEDVEAFFRTQQDYIAQGIATAPNDEVKSALETLGRGTEQMMGLLADAEWNMFAVDPDAMDAISDDPAFEAASDTVDAYSERECDIDTGETSDGDDGASDADDGANPFEDNPDALDSMLGNDAFRQQLVESIAGDSEFSADQINCLLDNLDLELLMSMSTEPDSLDPDAAGPLLDVFAGCGIDPTQLG